MIQAHGMTRQELADMTGVSVERLRKWQQKGLIDPPAGTGYGPNRYFTMQHYHRVEDIKRLLDNNMLLEDIRDRFNLIDDDASPES